MKSNEFPFARLFACSLAIAVLLLPSGAAGLVTDPTLSVTFTRSGTNLILNWNGFNGVPYSVQVGSNLTNFNSVGPAMTGTGGQMSFTNSGFNLSRSFFRVQRLFPAAPGTASFNPTTGLLTVV